MKDLKNKIIIIHFQNEYPWGMLQLQLQFSVAKHLNVTSANCYANKVNQNKILGFSTEHLGRISIFGTFWHHLCHSKLLRYQTIFHIYVTKSTQKVAQLGSAQTYQVTWHKHDMWHRVYVFLPPADCSKPLTDGQIHHLWSGQVMWPAASW